MGAMQIATFAVSILAVLVAGISALSSQRSASAAERAAARDPWELIREEKGGQWLKNTSRRTAFGVTMTAPGEQPAVRLADVPAGETIHAGARRRLNVGIGMTPIPPRVTITWRESEDGSEQEWTTGL